jgi:hypothetical protein
MVFTESFSAKNSSRCGSLKLDGRILKISKFQAEKQAKTLSLISSSIKKLKIVKKSFSSCIESTYLLL